MSEPIYQHKISLYVFKDFNSELGWNPKEFPKIKIYNPIGFRDFIILSYPFASVELYKDKLVLKHKGTVVSEKLEIEIKYEDINFLRFYSKFWPLYHAMRGVQIVHRSKDVPKDVFLTLQWNTKKLYSEIKEAAKKIIYLLSSKIKSFYNNAQKQIKHTSPNTA